MKRHRSVASLALAVLAVVILAGPAAAQQRAPFQGSLQGTFTITPVTPPFIVDVLLTAQGEATQLGRFTLIFPHRVDRSTVPSTGVGIYTFKAANGDMVFAKGTGKATPTATPGVLAGVEIGTITGGTGRFAGATGSFICERLIDTVNLKTIGSFRGTISTP